jgi:hypothetical protein
MPTPLPVLPGVYYARVRGEFGGKPSSNVFAFKLDGSPPDEGTDATNAEQVAIALSDNWGFLANAVYNVSYSAIDVQVYPLGHATLPAASQPVVGTGGNGSTQAPSAVALLIKHDVVRRGRGSQSRSFFTPITAPDIEGDGITITPTFVTAVQAAWDTFITSVIADLAAATLVMDYVQLSKLGAGATYAISRSQVETEVSTQRARAQRL